MTLKIRNRVNLCVASGDTAGTVRSAVSWRLVGLEFCWGLLACSVCPVRSPKDETQDLPFWLFTKACQVTIRSVALHIYVCVYVCVLLCLCVCSILSRRRLFYRHFSKFTL